MRIRVPGAVASMLVVRLLAPAECRAALDPSHVVGPEKCASCHKAEYKVWQTTTHATMFTLLHKKDAAVNIAAAIGARTIKTDSVCMDCHFTPVPMSGRTTSTAGVSCESCHGAARDWINVHNDLGGFTRENEPADHRKNRLAAAIRAGMVPPADDSLYDLIGNCYGCHTVPNEKLVNVGGHSTGGTFDVLDRVHAIRHNFLDSHGNVNAELPAAEKRRIYLFGAVQQLRTSLRNTTLATEDGRFSKDAGKRVKSAVDDLKVIQDQLQLPALQEMLLSAKGLALRPGNREVLYALNKIAAAAKGVSKTDDRRLAGIQALFDAPHNEAQVEEATSPAAQAAQPSPAAEPEKGLIKRIRNIASPAREASVAAALPSMTRRIHAASKYRTLGPSTCSSSCHSAPNAWWEKDKHYGAADRLLNDDPKAMKIARLYGLSAKEMKNGQNICTDCHATTVTGKEARDAADGVGCENCHGPAGDWIKIHNQNDKFNPAAFSSGMVQLADVHQRAQVCTGCHYINEPRLISTGHPSNSKFDYVQALARIKHWKTPFPANESWKEAVTAAIASRGPVPGMVSLASAETKSSPAAEPARAEMQTPPAAGVPSRTADLPARPAQAQPRSADLQPIEAAPEQPPPAAAAAAASPRTIAITPGDPIRENASITDLLRIAQKRLETLYQQTGSRP